ALTLLFRSFNLKQYQIIQERVDKLKLKAIKNKVYDESETAEILRVMKRYCGEGVNIEVEFVDEIPTTKAGKRRYIISEVPKLSASR
ncbi:unnamed protein product, partial [marine sediment metagenome]